MTAREIQYLADLIEGGRLPWPLDLGQLQFVGPQATAPEVRRLLTGAASTGASSAAVVWFLRAIADERAVHEAVSAKVQPIVSGPRFVPDLRETDAAFREIISEAKRNILITGFALHNGHTVLATLAERMDRDPGLSVVLCLDIARPHGDTSDEHAIVARFAHRFRSVEWPGSRLPRVYYDPRSLASNAESRSSFHAKVAVADSSQVLIGSANLTEAAFSRNIEIGVLVSLPVFAARVREHIESLCREKILLGLPL